MPRSRLLLSLCAGLVLLYAITVCRAEPFRFPEKRHGKGELRYLNKIPVLTVEGTPEEIGEQVGVLALRPAARVLDYPRGLLDQFSAGGLWGLAIKQGKAMVDRVLAADPKYPEALYVRGLINLMGLRRPGAAERDFSAYLIVAPFGSHRTAAVTLLALAQSQEQR